MCLIAFSLDPQRSQPLILAANRDEYFERPTNEPAWWADHPAVFGGRDTQAGGTWMAVSLPAFQAGATHRTCRFAALTNVRGGASTGRPPTSRGHLVTHLLNSGSALDTAMLELSASGARYDGYNLLAFEWQQWIDPEATGSPAVTDLVAWHLSNRGHFRGRVVPVEHGVHVVSNGAFDEDWPKTGLLAKAMRNALDAPDATEADKCLLTALKDTRPASETCLPQTGIDIAAEKALSMPFIRTRFAPADEQATYGTRTSTLFNLHQSGECRFRQISWDTQALEPVMTGAREMYAGPFQTAV